MKFSIAIYDATGQILWCNIPETVGTNLVEYLPGIQPLFGRAIMGEKVVLPFRMSESYKEGHPPVGLGVMRLQQLPDLMRPACVIGKFFTTRPAVLDLSPREQEILTLTSLGWTVTEIALEMGTAANTVQAQKQSIRLKLGFKTSESLTAWAGRCRMLFEHLTESTSEVIDF